jgi:hypothetical protein
MDFERFLTALSTVLDLSPSAIGESLRQEFNENDENIQIGKYAVYYSQRGPIDAIVNNEDKMLIDTSGTKLRFGELALVEIGDFLISSIIMHRK